MEPKVFYYVNLVLCGMVFLELLITFRKNPLLKLYFLTIIASLFAMNYFSITGVDTRLQIFVVKSVRTVYTCSTLLALIYIVNQKIPRWFIALVIFSAAALTSFRLFYFDQIDVEGLSHVSNQVFSVGPELYTPKPMVRVFFLALSLVGIIIGYYYYRRMLMRMNWESSYYKPLSRWIISFVAPFFLLSIFGFLGNLKLFNETLSSYLFAFFSCSIICSFILRPRFLDTGMNRERGETDKQPLYNV